MGRNRTEGGIWPNQVGFADTGNHSLGAPVRIPLLSGTTVVPGVESGFASLGDEVRSEPVPSSLSVLGGNPSCRQLRQ